MNILERYELMLKQAMEEIGPLDLPADEQEASEAWSEFASDLGDVLYRLSIEHAMPFAPFKETVIAILSGQQPALVTTGGQTAARPFASHLAAVHPVIILALEMMPTEPADL